MDIVFSCSLFWGANLYYLLIFNVLHFFYKLFFPFNKRIYIDICISKLYALSFVRINATNLKQFSKNVRIYSIISFYEDADIDDIGADGGGITAVVKMEYFRIFV